MPVTGRYQAPVKISTRFSTTFTNGSWKRHHLKIFPALCQHIVSITSVKTKTSDVQHQVMRRICKNLHILLLDVSIWGFLHLLEKAFSYYVAFTFFAITFTQYLLKYVKGSSFSRYLKIKIKTCMFVFNKNDTRTIHITCWVHTHFQLLQKGLCTDARSHTGTLNISSQLGSF